MNDANESAEKPESCRTCPCPARRQFLKQGLTSLSALAMAGPAASLLQACSQEGLSSGEPSTGTVGTLPNRADNLYTLDLATYPALANPGGSIAVTVLATSGAKTVFVTRVDSSTARTVSTICTHAGCTLEPYDPGAQQYTCLCHGSVFNSNGSVSLGPAVTALPSYASTLTATGVQVTIP